MCGEFNVTGVLVATKDKQGVKACSIPKSCDGLIEQTSFLPQDVFFRYVQQSRFVFLPQIHDASPRVSTQALAFDVPILMNRNIIGGWKYLNENTGEFFNDMDDFRTSLRKILTGSYKPREYIMANYGDTKSGPRLKDFVTEHFSHRVKLPEGTRMLFPSGA